MQRNLFPVENSIGPGFKPLAGIDIAAVFVQTDIYGKMTMTENKKIVVFTTFKRFFGILVNLFTLKFKWLENRTTIAAFAMAA